MHGTLSIRCTRCSALEAIRFSNSMYFRLIPLLSLLLAAHLGWADQAPESDQYLQRLTETQSFSLGRPTLATPTTDGKSVIFLRAISAQDRTHALYEFKTVTTDGTNLKSYGSAEFVAQEEMGRTSGYWWLPDSRSIVYQVNDNSRVEVWNVADPAYPENSPIPTRYPRPGKPNVSVRLAVCA